MEWLTNWDDLVHGTAVFGAALPFAIGLLFAWKAPERFWWLGVACAIIGSFLWLFGFPNLIPRSSDDVGIAGLVLAVAVLLVPSRRYRWAIRLDLGSLLFGALAWSIYPAWLADGGTLSRKLLVCGGLAASAALVAALAELAHRPGETGKGRVSLSAFIPPTVTLAALLQIGGAARFGQAVGALGAALGAVAVLLMVRKSKAKPQLVAAIWGALFVLFAWSGWLFAELRYGLAALLLLAPVAALLVRKLPLPRHHAFLEHLWDGLASAIVSGAIAAIAISEYMAEMSEFEGY